jgi:hypothetical protein
MKIPENENQIKVSIRSDGSVKFGPDALAAFKQRGIESIGFHQLYKRPVGIRWLTLQEARDLCSSRACNPALLEDDPRDFLRTLGIHPQKGKQYPARWIEKAKGILVTIL